MTRVRTRTRISIPHVVDATFTKVENGSHVPRYWCPFFSDYPQSIENNLSKFLMDKANNQLSPFKSGHYVGLVVCDGGHRSISDPLFNSMPYHTVSGAKIFEHVISQTEVDFLACVGREDLGGWPSLSACNRLSYQFFSSPMLDPAARTKAIILWPKVFAKIPAPLLKPSLSKLLQREVSKRPININDYLGAEMLWRRDKPVIFHISARALFVFLSGAIDRDEFESRPGV